MNRFMGMALDDIIFFLFKKVENRENRFPRVTWVHLSMLLYFFLFKKNLRSEIARLLSPGYLGTDLDNLLFLFLTKKN